MKKLTLNDRILLTAIQKDYRFVQDINNKRAPKVGDIACIEAVLNHDILGYELACYDHRDDLIWRMKFSESAMEYHLINQ